jgi:O-antigen ligase
LLLGILAEVLQGNFRPFNSGYRFAGTLHPNAQSTNCGALALSTYALWQDAGRPESYRRRRISGGRLAFGMLFCFAVFFLVMTKSRTALAAVLLTTALLRATTQRAWSNLLIAATGLLACLTLAYVAAVFGAAGAVGDAASMGRDDSQGTFNGRLPIWEICWSEVGQRWPIGFGYDGFWTADRIESVSWKLGWSISSAHCEYIEIALGLGVIGVGLYLLVQVAGISRFWLRYFRLGHGGDAMILGLLMVGVMQGLMETGDLHPSSMTPFIVLTGMVRLAFFTPRKVALEGAV